MKPIEPLLILRSAGTYFKLTAMGFAIGTAGLIPGVSGGTLALLLGIYEELVEAIQRASEPETFRALLQRQWRALTRRLPWQLLLPVGIGALTAVVLMSHFMEWLLLTYPVQVEALFFGLVAASLVVVARKVRRWRLDLVLGFLLGVAGAWFLLDVTPAQTPNTLWMLFLSGAIAKCAMVLPGISGAFVLKVLGQYEYALMAVTQRDLLAVGVILFSAVVGLVTFSQALSWLFKRQRDRTLAVLAGLILASLRRLWPWKESTFCALGELIEQTNVWPTTWSAEVVGALLIAGVGFGVVLFLARDRDPEEPIPIETPA